MFYRWIIEFFKVSNCMEQSKKYGEIYEEKMVDNRCYYISTANCFFLDRNSTRRHIIFKAFFKSDFLVVDILLTILESENSLL